MATTAVGPASSIATNIVSRMYDKSKSYKADIQASRHVLDEHNYYIQETRDHMDNFPSEYSNRSKISIEGLLDEQRAIQQNEKEFLKKDEDRGRMLYTVIPGTREARSRSNSEVRNGIDKMKRRESKHRRNSESRESRVKRREREATSSPSHNDAHGPDREHKQSTRKNLLAPMSHSTIGNLLAHTPSAITQSSCRDGLLKDHTVRQESEQLPSVSHIQEHSPTPTPTSPTPSVPQPALILNNTPRKTARKHKQSTRESLPGHVPFATTQSSHKDSLSQDRTVKQGSKQHRRVKDVNTLPPQSLPIRGISRVRRNSPTPMPISPPTNVPQPTLIPPPAAAQLAAPGLVAIPQPVPNPAAAAPAHGPPAVQQAPPVRRNRDPMYQRYPTARRGII